MVTGIGSVADRVREATAILRARGETMSPRGGPVPLEFIEMQAEGIERISMVFPLFFIAVTGLVVFMTITRMIESERGQIGTLKTLGYRQDQIVAKYVFFTLIASVIGVALGIVVGHFGVAEVIVRSITNNYGIPHVSGSTPFVGLVSVLTLIGFCLAVTGFTALHTVRQNPAKLLVGKAPKIGGKILLERIPFLWKPLPFRYKSSLRNIFRYRVRFFMTVFSMAFSTALVFCGIALAFSLEHAAPEMMDSIRPISTIIVLAAIFLNAMVIYNITSINIDERNREIATLKVLGYKNFEVCGYVFREIFLLTIIGVAAGLPIGFLAMGFFFDYLQFGGTQYIYWYVWFITTVLSFTALALADLLLFRKIHKIDMNTSLKVVE